MFEPPKEICKCTEGCVIQRWDAQTGDFLGQKFIAGDQVSYEDEDGNPIDYQEPHYHSYDMDQTP